MDDRPRAPRDDRGHPARPDRQPDRQPGRSRTEGSQPRSQQRGSAVPTRRATPPPGAQRPRPPAGSAPRRTPPPIPDDIRNALADTDRTPPVVDPPKTTVSPKPKARPATSSSPLTRPAPQRRAVGAITGRTVLAIASVLALVATGYAWSTLRDAQDGLQTADVLDQTPKPPDGSMDILLVGMDSRTDAKGNPLPAAQLDALHAGQDTGELDTDTMILIHIPTGGGKAIGVSIPRDSWVNIPGYGMGKINSAYGLAKNAAERTLQAQGVTGSQLELQSDDAGAKESIQTVEALTGVGIDHYAAINLEGFYQISNAIGGVPVCLLHPVNDIKWSGAVFPAGHFTVQGVQALEFVRQRHNIPGGSTDIEREQRQQAFMASMAHKMLSSGVLSHPGTLNNLIGAIQSAVTIDNHWNLIDFAQEMSGMSSGAIKFQTVPVENIDYFPYGDAPGEPSAVEVDPAQVAAFVHGTTGAPVNTSGVQGAPAAPTGNSAITVDVTNASGATGLAAQVLAQLGGKGFNEGSTGDASHRESSVLYFASGQEADAQAVADALPGQFLLEEGPSVPSGHVWVYLGRDYHGANDAADTIVGPVHQPQAVNIAAPVTSAPTTTASTPPGGTAPITDNGTAPCIN